LGERPLRTVRRRDFLSMGCSISSRIVQRPEMADSSFWRVVVLP
jgi:hypothetical protein